MGLENSMPEGWVETTLGDLMADKGYIRGPFGSALKRGEMLDHGVPVYEQANAIYNHRKFRYFISSDKHLTLYRFTVKPNDILISCSGTFGKTTIINEDDPKGIISQALLILRSNPQKIDTYYLNYFLNSREGKIKLAGMSHGSVQVNIAKRADVESIEFLLPPLPEQKAIAKILTAFDDKIELLQAQNKTLETILKVKHEDLFTVCSSVDCPKVKVGDYVKTNSISINKNYDHNSILYMDTGSLTNGVTESLQEIKLSEAPSRAKRLVKHNDILISTVRPNQKHFGIIKYPINNLVVSTGFCVISCEKIDPHFLYYVLTSNDMTDYLHSIAEGSTSTYPSIKPIDLESVEFVLPPNDRIEKFSKTASIFWDKIHLNQIQVKSLTKTRDTLLPKLMSGQVRVKNIKHTADA